MRTSREGPIILRVTTFDFETVRHLATKDHVLAALDLAGSLEPERRTPDSRPWTAPWPDFVVDARPAITVQAAPGGWPSP